MSAPDDLAPVAEDLSAYLIAGAVKATQPQGARDTEARTPLQGIEDGVAAEQLGFRRVWLSERWDIKLADVLLSGIAARTSRVQVGTGLIAAPTRTPMMLAGLGATMHACYGPRFALGLGRGIEGYMQGSGLDVLGYRAFGDLIDIVRALWRGEPVTYDGPAGRLDGIRFAEVHDGPDPEIWFGTFANPRGARLVAERCDGVLLPPTLVPEATYDAVQRIRTACERIDRDPAEVRICQCVVTAPDLDEIETRSLVHGRAVGYLQYEPYGDYVAKANGWDAATVRRIRGHDQFQGLDVVADRLYHRHELLEPASLIPEQWMLDSNAYGTVDECVMSLQRFMDAGADEIATYGSTPAQNAGLIEAWRRRSRRPAVAAPV
ncbi:TIGR03857 family LLM class F420-dependent oxidoreductase [Patulibacter sp. NPDC049589]|uniref:TIGR03857 family LLM class F420-dependent oxidoreductase n=1 Tax=Patulibacter sp. NPDC049589 TaxID=3154731 RepID=UPI00343E52AB